MTYAEIDRGIYEAVRLKAVELGVLPDITLYTTVPEWEAAKEALRQAGKQVVDVFGVGSADSRGELRINSLTIERTYTDMGEIGGFGGRLYDPATEGPGYDVYRHPDSSVDLTYTLRTMARKVSYSNLLEEIVLQAIGSRRTLPAIGEDGQPTGEYFDIYRGQTDNLSSKGFLAMGIQIFVPHVWVEKPVFVERAAEITDVGFQADPAPELPTPPAE